MPVWTYITKIAGKGADQCGSYTCRCSSAWQSMQASQSGSWGAASSVHSCGSASHIARPTAATLLAADTSASSCAAVAAAQASSQSVTCWRKRSTTSCT